MRVIWRFELLPPPEVTTLHLPTNSQLRAFGYQRLGGREASFNAWFHVNPAQKARTSWFHVNPAQKARTFREFSIHATGQEWDETQWGDVKTFLDPQTGLVWTLLERWQ
jgi:hypothetical protein